MVPRIFRSLRALRALNVLGLGLSLGAATGIGFGHLHSGHFTGANRILAGLPAFDAGLPTLLAGVAWALLLRSRRTVGKTRLRLGWLLSVPLAMAAAGLSMVVGRVLRLSSSAILDQIDSSLLETTGSSWVFTFLEGTLQINLWLPVLALTLLGFGAPIARAQRLSEQGLAGEERGEWMVGTMIALLSMASLVLVSSYASTPLGGPSYVRAWLFGVAQAGLDLLRAMASLGLLAGLTSMALAIGRERWRQRFVAQVEEGKVPGFRVDDTAQGRVLVRVTSPEQEGYRAGDLDVGLVELDEQGVAIRSLGG